MVNRNQAIKKIINKRLIDIPLKIKAEFHPVFSQLDMSYINIMTDKYLLIVFIDNADKARIDKMVRLGYDPFPGLLTDDLTNK